MCSVRLCSTVYSHVEDSLSSLVGGVLYVYCCRARCTCFFDLKLNLRGVDSPRTSGSERCCGVSVGHLLAHKKEV